MKKVTCLLFCIQLVNSWGKSSDIVPVPCNDKIVEKIARLGLTYINEDRSVGYKFSLNRISNVHLHAQGPSGNVYYMNLDVLETKCHVKSPKLWKRCDIRPFRETQISGNCNTTILHTPRGFSYLHSYDCTLIPDQPEELLKICPDCPLLLPVDSTEALQAAQLTLHKYNTQNHLPTLFTLQDITRASQVLSKSALTQSSFVEYTVQDTECTLRLLNAGLCKSPDPGSATAGFCVGAVHSRGKSEPDVVVSCEIFHHQIPGTAVGSIGQAVAATRPEKPTNTESKASVTEVHRPKLSDPLQTAMNPKDRSVQLLTPVPHVPSSFSSESNSNSESSEELGAVIARPPLGFRYEHHRLRREAAPNIPEFMSVFPSARSPFRSCPGAPRYTTV